MRGCPLVVGHPFLVKGSPINAKYSVLFSETFIRSQDDAASLYQAGNALEEPDWLQLVYQKFPEIF